MLLPKTNFVYLNLIAKLKLKETQTAYNRPQKPTKLSETLNQAQLQNEKIANAHPNLIFPIQPSIINTTMNTCRSTAARLANVWALNSHKTSTGQISPRARKQSFSENQQQCPTDECRTGLPENQHQRPSILKIKKQQY